MPAGKKTATTKKITAKTAKPTKPATSGRSATRASAAKPISKPASVPAKAASAARGPRVGDRAPRFELPDQNGSIVGLDSLLGNGPIVLYFYPKADSKACTEQACAFAEAHGALNKLGAVVVGISPDAPKALARFAAKHALKFTLLSDVPHGDGLAADARTIGAFGAWGAKSMYGNTYMGVIRTTVVLSAKGVVVARFENVKVTNAGNDHATEVLAAISRAR